MMREIFTRLIKINIEDYLAGIALINKLEKLAM